MRKKLPHGSFLLRFTNSSNSGQSGIKGTKGSGPGAISRHGGTRFVIRGNQSVLSGRSSHEFSHLFQHYGRIFVHLRPIQRSKIVPQGELVKTLTREGLSFLRNCLKTYRNPRLRRGGFGGQAKSRQIRGKNGADEGGVPRYSDRG